MKRKFFSFIFAFAFLFVGGLCLSACNNECDIRLVNEETSALQFADENNSYTNLITVKSGSNVSIDLMLSNAYERDSLKIYNGNTELTWEKSSDYDDAAAIDYQQQKVGSLTLNNVKSNITLTFEVDEKEIEFSFERNSEETTPLTTEQKQILQQFALVNPDPNLPTVNLLQALATDGYTYKTTYSKLADGIPVICTKPVGYYKANYLNSVFTDNLSAGTNRYAFRVSNLSEGIHRSNALVLNLAELDINQFAFENKTGFIAKVFKNDDATPIEYVKANEIAGNYSVKLNTENYAGFDTSNAEVYLGLQKLNYNDNLGAYTFTLTENQLPFTLGDEFNFSYYITVKNVNVTSTTNMLKLSAIGDPNIIKIGDSSYYYDSVNKTAYYTDYTTSNIKVDMYSSEGIQTFTITKNNVDYTVNLTEIYSSLTFDADGRTYIQDKFLQDNPDTNFVKEIFVSKQIDRDGILQVIIDFDYTNSIGEISVSYT